MVITENVDAGVVNDSRDLVESSVSAVAESQEAVDLGPELSLRFLGALGVYTRRVRTQWELCALAGVSSEQFSKLVRGRLPLRPMDERITRVGRILGLEPAECFEAQE